MLFRKLFKSLTSGGSRPPVRPSPRRRPAGCRLSVEALDGRIVPASLSVGDTVIVEGNADTTQIAVVSVTLDAPANKTVRGCAKTAHAA